MNTSTSCTLNNRKATLMLYRVFNAYNEHDLYFYVHIRAIRHRIAYS